VNPITLARDCDGSLFFFVRCNNPLHSPDGVFTSAVLTIQKRFALSAIDGFDGGLHFAIVRHREQWLVDLDVLAAGSSQIRSSLQRSAIIRKMSLSCVTMPARASVPATSPCAGYGR
jgi:hypothetical protein